MMRSTPCGRSSVVERQLPKLYVEGSIPFARSICGALHHWNTDLTSTNEPMSVPDTVAPARHGRLATLLWLATGLAAVSAGLVLWSSRGERVFSDLVSATISWCL